MHVSVELNHTIVPSRDKRGSSAFLARILGLAAPVSFAHFMAVELANGVTLDYDDREEFVSEHYAFLISEGEFDDVLSRLRAEAVTFYADPGHRRPGEVRRDRGRGLYFSDPDGHNMEVLTVPYTG